MVTHARVFSLSSRYDLFDEKSGLFIAAILQHTLLNSFNYSNMCSWAKIKDLSIKLPVTETEEIDWEFMEDYIKAIQKIVIKDVVKYKDEVIAKTKEAGRRLITAGDSRKEIYTLNGSKKPNINMILILFCIAMSLTTIMTALSSGTKQTYHTISYSDFIKEVDAGHIESVQVSDTQITAITDTGAGYVTDRMEDESLTDRLLESRRGY